MSLAQVSGIYFSEGQATHDDVIRLVVPSLIHSTTVTEHLLRLRPSRNREANKRDKVSVLMKCMF